MISAASALALLPIMFLLEWFGTVGLPRSRRSGLETAENAWHVLTYTRWLMLLAVAVGLGSVVLHASQRAHGARTDTSLVVATVGTVTAAMLAYRVLINLPDPSSVVDIKIGAYLGLLAAIGITLGGYDSIREERARRGRAARRPRRRNRLASRAQPR
jgi:NADH:ubiquinone oxidoreductase subunit 2 (subunit N)